MSEQKRSLEALELVGGIMCLDFTNTINSRREPEHDYLVSYSDLVDWAGKVEILSPQQTRNLRQGAMQDSKQAEKALEKARTAREVLYRVFSAIASRSEPQEEDLNAIADLIKEATANGQLVRAGDHYSMDWKADETLASTLWRIISSAEDLLRSDELSRVKECPGCGWLFLDTSKNRSRTWCSMNTCGVRDKMRRYYKRRKAK